METNETTTTIVTDRARLTVETQAAEVVFAELGRVLADEDILRVLESTLAYMGPLGYFPGKTPKQLMREFTESYKVAQK